VSIVEVVRITQNFPRSLEEEENETIIGEVTKGEVEGILRSMKNDKNPSPDGWTMEFFQHFFESLGN